MKTCACCGQSLKSSGRPIVKVDDALLALCNAAYAHAQARSSAEVLIADLTWCIARSPRWTAEIEAGGMAPDHLARYSELALSRSGSRGRPMGPLATCDDLKTLLARAEQRARDRGRPAAEPGDVLHVLFRGADDLAGADFASGRARPESRAELSDRPRERPLSMREHAGVGAWPDVRRDARLAEHAGTGIETALRSELSGLSRRLDAQTQEIARLAQRADALAHQLATALTQLLQAGDHARAHGEMIAELQRRLRESTTGGSDLGLRHTVRNSMRSRLRRARRRSLLLRLRQRRRARRRALRSWIPRRSLRGPGERRIDPATPPTSAVVRTAHPAPLATHLVLEAERFEALPCPLAGQAPPNLSDEATHIPDFDEEIAEPIENDDDFEFDGALGDRPKRFYLALDDDVERAPSIGPRTAARLAAAGVATVRELLSCNPREVATRVQSRYVSAERLTAWKSQARLVCTVPWLRGTHAQLLVGAGYDTIDKLQRARASDVSAGILRFAVTREGQSVLRSGPPPAPERVAAWMGHVTLAEPERARLAA